MKIIKKIDVPFQTPAFIYSIAFDDSNFTYVVLGSDSIIYFFIKGKIKYKFTKKINAEKIAGCKQLKIWHIHQKQLWITSGEDFRIREWDFERTG